jgi:pimeloyl-ACP methyl ester carboxylesterase
MQPDEGYLKSDDGVRLFYRKVGTGADTVIVPNGMYLIEDFKRLANGRTLVVYDPRNRGRSDTVDDPSKLARGILNDVDDLEAIRRQLSLERVALLGHSYVGLLVILYAMKYPDRITRIVQIGPMEPRPGKTYPAHLTANDTVVQQVFARLAELQKEPAAREPEEQCRKFWSVLGAIYVTNPADAARIDWGRCDLPNERNFMKYWMGSLMHSMKALNLAEGEFAKVTSPVLTIHGTKDRSAPYGGGREWALLLPNARLVTVEGGGHAPWIESPQVVFSAIETFLAGGWPDAAQRVERLDPNDGNA